MLLVEPAADQAVASVVSHPRRAASACRIGQRITMGPSVPEHADAKVAHVAAAAQHR